MLYTSRYRFHLSSIVRVKPSTFTYSKYSKHVARARTLCISFSVPTFTGIAARCLLSPPRQNTKQIFPQPPSYCTMVYRIKLLLVFQISVKAKQSLYRPGHSLVFTVVWASQISGQSACESGKVVCPTNRPPLHHRRYPGTHFC
jgi:hypothetical protein